MLEVMPADYKFWFPLQSAALPAIPKGIAAAALPCQPTLMLKPGTIVHHRQLLCLHNCSCCCRLLEAQLPCRLLGLATGLGLGRVQRCKHQQSCAQLKHALLAQLASTCMLAPPPLPPATLTQGITTSSSLKTWCFLLLQGYAAAGQTDAALDSLRWIADYFVKNHHGDLAFTGQIGNVAQDHSSWGRPEDMTGARPGFDLNPSAPGMPFCHTTLSDK